MKNTWIQKRENEFKRLCKKVIEDDSAGTLSEKNFPKWFIAKMNMLVREKRWIKEKHISG